VGEKDTVALKKGRVQSGGGYCNREGNLKCQVGTNEKIAKENNPHGRFAQEHTGGRES